MRLFKAGHSEEVCQAQHTMHIIGHTPCCFAVLQVAQHTCQALLQWLRAHYALLVGEVRRSRVRSSTSGMPAVPPPQPYKPVDVSEEATAVLMTALECDRRLAETVCRMPFPALEVGSSSCNSGVASRLGRSEKLIL